MGVHQAQQSRGLKKEHTETAQGTGIDAPDAFWKVLIRKDRPIAWVIPNTADATRKRLDQYLVSIAAGTAVLTSLRTFNY